MSATKSQFCLARAASRKRFAAVRTACATRLLPLLLLLTLPAVVQAQFNYTTNNGTITITKYTGSGGSVTIPSTINDLPVANIGDYAFYDCASLTSVTIPNSISSIGEWAFYSCTSLASITIPNGVTNGGLAFGYCSSLSSVTIGNSVTSIGTSAFSYCTNLTTVTIPNRVASIERAAFSHCTSLAGVFFKGNAPTVDSFVFYYSNPTVHYLPGTTNWYTPFGGRPVVLWNPQVQASGASFGVRTNRFGFTITGTSNLVIVVEACTDLANPIWSPVGTNTLAGGSSYFSNPQWTNYPARLYRLRSP